PQPRRAALRQPPGLHADLMQVGPSCPTIYSTVHDAVIQTVVQSAILDRGHLARIFAHDITSLRPTAAAHLGAFGAF
ncbi:MAG: hypothetical protein MUQ10_10770, partial [Anaerolineae bacterium]|nr:hypothetical protein [Anaerolineae bacterium]